MTSKKLTLPLLFAAIGLIGLTFAASGSANSPAKKEVTFNKDVAPIIFKNCVECHRANEAAPMSLMSYKEARPWAKSIKEKVINREMPPWHADPHFGEFSNDRRLTQKDQNDSRVGRQGGEGRQCERPAARAAVRRRLDDWQT